MGAKAMTFRICTCGSEYFQSPTLFFPRMEHYMSSNRSTSQTQDGSGNLCSLQGAQPLFDTGFICVSPGVLVHLVSHGITAESQLRRHVRGDWGIVPSDDAMVNWLAVQHGERVMSIYEIAGKQVWIITERDRSVTTLLFPEEY
jgi:hypothetical protein